MGGVTSAPRIVTMMLFTARSSASVSRGRGASSGSFGMAGLLDARTQKGGPASALRPATILCGTLRRDGETLRRHLTRLPTS